MVWHPKDFRMAWPQGACSSALKSNHELCSLVPSSRIRVKRLEMLHLPGMDVKGGMSPSLRGAETMYLPQPRRAQRGAGDTTKPGEEG